MEVIRELSMKAAYRVKHREGKHNNTYMSL